MEEGGEVAENLSRLYDFCVHSLNKANTDNSVEALEAVNKVINEVKAGWEGISSERGSKVEIGGDSDQDGYTQGVAQGGV